MERQKNNQKDNASNIELRSEKVQKLVDEVPQRLVRRSMAVILIIFILLIIALVYIPYPYGEEGESILRHILIAF